MIVLDEHVAASQRDALAKKGIRVRQIGVELGRKGLLDPEIIPLLHRLVRATFFTQDLGFYNRGLRHPRYALVVLAVSDDQVAEYMMRVLSHPRFSRSRDRLGKVVLAFHEGLRCWSPGANREQRLPWVRR